MNTDRIREKLERRLQELDVEMDKLEAESGQPLDADWSEQANQIEDVDTAEGLESVRLEEAADIRAAIQRIDDGKYGTCANCGAEIAEARLLALPTATLCINCAP